MCVFVTLGLTLRPKDWMQMTTEFKFCLSQRSTLWNVSCVGTPKFLAHSKKAENKIKKKLLLIFYLNKFKKKFLKGVSIKWKRFVQFKMIKCGMQTFSFESEMKYVFGSYSAKRSSAYSANPKRLKLSRGISTWTNWPWCYG